MGLAVSATAELITVHKVYSTSCNASCNEHVGSPLNSRRFGTIPLKASFDKGS